ncbi:MAG: glutathione S-transferase N-terminal domain-containing protein [Pseudomonadota bacterium]
MTSLADHPISQRWPAQHPDRIQLYSFPTPNGIKVSAALEELGLPYEAHTVHIGRDDQLTPEFLSLNPNNKIPAMIDPDGPGGVPLPLWESGAILLYLAEKTGKLIPSDPAERWETVQWLMFQMAGVGPMFGQMGHFYKFMADKVSDPYPSERYVKESRRLTGVLDARLDGRAFIMGDDYTIADIAIWPWLATAVRFYEAGDAMGISDFSNALAWMERCAERPASKSAVNIPPRE